jgi:Lysylphosphatidylglycerol synthase TM region
VSARVKCWLRWLALVALLLVAGRMFARQLAATDWARLTIGWNWLVVALAVNLLYVLLYARLWEDLAQFAGMRLSAREAWGIYLYAIPGKYLPLRVAGLGYRWLAYRQRGGWSAQRVAGALYLETALVLASGGGVVAVLSPFVDWRALRISAAVWIACGGLLLGVLLLPRLLTFLAHRCSTLEWAREFGSTLSAAEYLRLFMRYSCAWLVAGLALTLTIKAFAGSPAEATIIRATWSYAVAGLAGMLVIVAPAGIGVRDGMLTLALSTIVPPGLAAIIAIAARVLNLTAEMICAVAGGLLLQNTPINGSRPK